MSWRAYTSIVVGTFVLLAAGNLLYSRVVRLSCWSGGYARDAFMAYCESEKYGIYDIDAIYFGVEPDAVSAIQRAQVLTLSDSHLQNALSLGGASEWFSGHNLRAYFLGLPTEQSGFGEMLWDKLKPHPAVVILDASPYFSGKLGFSEETIIDDAKTRHDEAFELKDFQVFHQKFCQQLSWICGHNFTYFRSRQDGHWIFPEAEAPIWIRARSVPNDRSRYPTSSTTVDDLPARYPEYRRAASRLISKFGIPARCIVITHVPNNESHEGLARYLAATLGLTLVDPVLPPLATFDQAHLTPESSRRWTQAFLEELAPTLQACVPGDSAG